MARAPKRNNAGTPMTDETQVTPNETPSVEETTEQSSDTPSESTSDAPTETPSEPDATQAPVETPPPADTVEGANGTPEVIQDTATPKVEDTTPPEENPAPEPVAVAPVNEDVDQESLDNLSILNQQLAVFKAAAEAPGNIPEEFRPVAAATLRLTKFVLKFPKQPILDALLAFFEENKDGVCAPEHYLKGSTLLGKADEQQVGFLYNLFADLANRRAVRVNASLIINVLKKPEIVHFYERKMKILQR